MKIEKLIKISIFGLIFFSYSEKSSAQKTEKLQQDLSTPLQLKNWKLTPVVNNRVASQNDVDSGNAIFYIEGKSESGDEHPHQ